ncbi:MAG TPA: hypothetical protein EYH31_02385 [Anaerolineae bacterium]|nr:hypothetical protein [Anaerolineae bacterium]
MVNYRYLNALFDLTPRFFGFWERLPTRSLGLILGIVLGIAGAAVTAYAADRIRASEIGQVRTFWWKIAIALFASRWWFRSPPGLSSSQPARTCAPACAPSKRSHQRSLPSSPLVRKPLRKGYHVRLLDILLFGDDSIAEIVQPPPLRASSQLGD